MVLVAFDIDDTTPHPGIKVEDGVAFRVTNGGWVTLKSSQPLTPNNRQWGVKIVDQGEGSDGSGLMLGVLPKLHSNTISIMSTKYISEMGGWCLSRAGESYGSWKCERIPFGTGSVVEFELDSVAKTLHVVCGDVKAVGHIPSLAETEEYYPAVSMYYLNQKVVFV